MLCCSGRKQSYEQIHQWIVRDSIFRSLCGSRRRTPVQFGAAIWPFQWNPPYDDGIRRIARLGFRQIELIAWDRDTLKTYYTSERIAALRQLIADEGLTLSEFVTTPNG